MTTLTTARNRMADTDQQQRTPRMSNGIDWKAFGQYVGVTVGGLALSVGAWTHGVLIGHGDRLTTIETKEVVREKQNEKDAAATASALAEIKSTAEKSSVEIRAELKDLGRGVEQLRVELARSGRAATATGGTP
jgi:hypothetical protein